MSEAARRGQLSRARRRWPEQTLRRVAVRATRTYYHGGGFVILDKHAAWTIVLTSLSFIRCKDALYYQSVGVELSVVLTLLYAPFAVRR
jgi:hypothetical protein